jgi:signal transduction histidine kinase
MMPESRTDDWWWLRPLRSGGRVSVLDVALGVALAGFGVGLVTGLIGSPGRHGGIAAALAVLTMTLPVVWRRQAPVAVAAVLGSGAVLNAVAIGRMVRCGPALPALLLCAFALGRRTPRLGWRPVSFAIACLVVSAAVQSVTDPNLDPSILVAMVPMTVALYSLGRLVESRNTLNTRLSEHNDELRLQRERIAQLAIQADRARIAEGLDESLSSGISAIAMAAETGRQALAEDTEPDVAHEAFVTIERRGRETLQKMREAVGTLLETGAPSEPQPTLRQLDQLVARAGPADVRVHVTGRPRVLPAGVELSGYRTMEHLLAAFGDTPAARIDIYVDFGADVLEMKVCGPAVAVADQQAALAAARARVAIHNGTLSSTRPRGEWEAIARLPLVYV